jgi:cytochrome oxidase Cu insertion factor (SCO1/SenC/PrrC family)
LNIPGIRRLAAVGLSVVLLVMVSLPFTATGSAPEGATRHVRVMNTIPKFRLDAQDGTKWGSKELEGKAWIATFVFTSCGLTCPLQMTRLAELESELAGHPQADDLRFVVFTVDPVHDTPDVMRQFGERYDLDPARSVLLTGTVEEMRALVTDGFQLPMQAASGGGGGAGHSQAFVLVDRARRMRGHYDALDAGTPAALQRDLDSVLRDPPGPIYVSRNLDRGRQEGNKAYVPWEVRDVPWLAERARQQEDEMAGRLRVVHDFRFTDRQPESGITFRNQVVEDAGKLYKGVHYDHGTGLAVADVDGDGRLDLYFVNQLGGNQLWRNLGAGRFEDITLRAGVAAADRVNVAASFADTDNDGDADLLVTSVRKGNLLFQNDGHGSFRDISPASGLAYHGHSSSGVFFDYDKDGLVDLFLCNVGRYTTDQIGTGGYFVGLIDAFSGHLFPERTEPSLLYRNLGGNRFVDASRSTGLVHSGWTGAATPLDGNDDGWPDLYVLNMQGHDEYFENVEGKRFVRRSRELFPATPWGSMGIKSFDFDNDGLLDLYVTDMHTDMVDDFVEQATRLWYAEKMKATETFAPRFLNTDGRHVPGNAFFRNEGGGRFREISDQIGAETYWPWGLSTGDLNADGWQDVFITASMNYPYRYAVNSLLLNNEGQELLDSEFVLGVEPRRGGRTSTLWFHLDCTTSPDNQHYACRANKGSYDVYGALGSRSSAILDLDDDGDLDIVTNDFNSEPMVLVSDLAARSPGLHWLKLQLRGTRSQRAGLGSRVTVVAGGRSLTQVVDGQSGYLSQSAAPLYFGLGAAAQVERISVTWPRSKTQVVNGPIEANRLVTITEE